MDLGFETIGNATVVVHDDGPVLTCDPWIRGSAYFGSWGLSHEIPPAQDAAVLGAGAVWFSHGHPDHLNPTSLPLFEDRRILLPDHMGGRIAGDLRRDGYRVEVLPDGQWVRISDRVRVLCIADLLQDGVLLIDVGGTLVVNLNDAADHGWGGLVRRIVREFPQSYLLRLMGYGDADMINFFDEDGQRVPGIGQLRKEAGFEVGADCARMAETFGVTHYVPFSSFHRYQRADSAWANEFTTGVDDYPRGFRSDSVQLTPPYVQVDCSAAGADRGGGAITPIDPAEAPGIVLPPGDFGDDWADVLRPGELEPVVRYFQAVEHLARRIDHVDFVVGGREHRVPLGTGHGRSLTFEVPRHSLLQAVEWEIFDDLLIGNFMKTTLHGKWPASGLYPDFTPYVTKYADNGRAHTKAEVREYFAEYRRRLGTLTWLRATIEQKAKDGVRARLRPDSPAFAAARRAYARVQGASR
jgi:hypothetical protein